MFFDLEAAFAMLGSPHLEDAHTAHLQFHLFLGSTKKMSVVLSHCVSMQSTRGWRIMSCTDIIRPLQPRSRTLDVKKTAS